MIAYVILVLLESQDVSTPLPEALVRAAEAALGPHAAVSIRTVERGAPEPPLGSLGQPEGARAVARISWGSPARHEARVDVVVLATGRAMTEALTFEDSDPLRERGRAIGLVLASLLRPDATAAQAEVAPPPAARPASPPPDGVTAREPAPPAAPAAAPRWALDAAAEGGLAIGGSGSGAGGALGLRWQALRRVGLRLGVAGRFGQIGQAHATMMTFSAAGGVIASVLEPRPDRRLALALRADALLLYETLSHFSSDDDQPVRQGRLVPGATVMAELRWSLGTAAALLLAAGPEVVFGTTRVFVHDAEVTTLAPVRAVVLGGLTAAF